MTLRAIECNCASSSGESSRPVNTTTGTCVQTVVLPHVLEQLEP